MNVVVPHRRKRFHPPITWSPRPPMSPPSTSSGYPADQPSGPTLVQFPEPESVGPKGPKNRPGVGNKLSPTHHRRISSATTTNSSRGCPCDKPTTNSKPVSRSKNQPRSSPPQSFLRDERSGISPTELPRKDRSGTEFSPSYPGENSIEIGSNDKVTQVSEPISSRFASCVRFPEHETHLCGTHSRSGFPGAMDLGSPSSFGRPNNALIESHHHKSPSDDPTGSTRRRSHLRFEPIALLRLSFARAPKQQVPRSVRSPARCAHPTSPGHPSSSDSNPSFTRLPERALESRIASPLGCPSLAAIGYASRRAVTRVSSFREPQRDSVPRDASRSALPLDAQLPANRALLESRCNSVARAPPRSALPRHAQSPAHGAGVDAHGCPCCIASHRISARLPELGCDRRSRSSAVPCASSRSESRPRLGCPSRRRDGVRSSPSFPNESPPFISP